MGIVIIPVVIAVALVVWLVMVFHAKSHPKVSNPGDTPDHEVSGGIFQGDRRQMMPRRDAPADEEASGVENAEAARDEERKA